MANTTAKNEQTMLNQLQQAIDVSFKNPELLLTALTHPSYLAEHQDAKDHNQRLEFLGDAILGLIAAESLYGNYPDKPEGQLTRMRAAVVCESTLARIAEQLKLGNYIRLGRGEELSGGRQRVSILADTLEALAAAVFLDQGWNKSRQWLQDLLKDEIQKTTRGYCRDYKTSLQELVQQRGNESLSYRILSETGPDHDKCFIAGVFLNGKLLGKGSGRSKKEAEQQAARMTLNLVQK